MSRIRIARLSAGILSVALAGTMLSACTDKDDPQAANPTPPAETTEVSTPAETTSPSLESTTAESSTKESTSKESTKSAPKTTGRTSTASERNSKQSKLVDEVSEKFSSLAPESLFEQFDACTETALKGSYDCSGPEVGQFQFFDSTSKAASTTQLLTELRSSRVVEDTGRTVVGWSTLGTTAVITVVDNELGLVMQQMVSSDQEDPEEKIYELGLATPKADPEEEKPAKNDDTDTV
ncbi:hypothetical protein QP027_02600 [Corynebacterium breve]|uniref:Beta-N-acetylglucosaminidase n=1 Tax=Corynebacterium breve TaxID=3049799 RepID=A0ABY8VF87_9CORY|nr:hypothetical protein [Corynebacterium breve]WIM68311.1 hypothetical protein QP027_02600 [Corynebacterium breve]